MGQALVTLPDGRKAKVTFDTKEQLDATVADLTKGAPGQTRPSPGQAATQTPPQTPPPTQPGGASVASPGGVGETILNAGERTGGAVLGAPEAALKVGSGLAGSVAGGVAGLARGAGAGIASLAQGEGLAKAGQAFSDEATDTIEGVGNAMTYQPRTQGGRDAATVVEAPFKLLAAGADVAGRKAAELTHSPALGAVVNTAIQSAPALLGIRGGRVAAGAEEGAEAGASRGTAAAGGRPGPSTTTPAARAEAYASNLGLDWSRLGPAIQDNLTRIAKESGNLEKLDPEAVKRQALLGGLRVPVETTRGKLTRNATELRREAVASKTDAGQPIRDTDIRANRDIQANLEVLRGRKAGLRGGLHDPGEEGAPSSPSVRASTKATEDVGSSIQGSVRAKAQLSKKNYDALYKKARETEPNATVSAQPLQDFIKGNPEVLNPQIQHLGWLQSWLKKAKLDKEVTEETAPSTRRGALGESIEEPGSTATKTEQRGLKLNELQDLREKAGEISRAGGTDGYYAGRVLRAIDKTMQDVPDGAAAWKQANAAFRKHQLEFKDQALIKKLVTNKAGDRSVALEKTAQTIAKGSLDQIRQVKKTLLTQEGPKAARFEGRKAWRDLQGETVNRILEDARNVVATDEAERQVLTAAALRKSINSVGRDRLTEILGKNSTDELYRIMRAAKITRTEPAGRVTESGTVPNALVLMEKATKHFVPGAKYVVGAREAIRSLGERGRAVQEAKDATRSPLQTAAEESERRAARRVAQKRRQLTTLRAARGLAPGIGENANRPPPTLEQ